MSGDGFPAGNRLRVWRSLAQRLPARTEAGLGRVGRFGS